MRNFFEIVAEAFDPEAFSEEGQAWSTDPEGLRRSQELADRRKEISDHLTIGLGNASRAGYLVTQATGEVRGQHYGIESGLTMSPKKLGEFVAAVLRHGGNVIGLHAMDAAYRTSSVQASVRIPDNRKEAFEAETGLRLIIPRGMVPA